MIVPGLFIFFSAVVAFPGQLHLPRAECPFVQGCSCAGGQDTKQLECRNIGEGTISQIAEQYPLLEVLTVSGWDGGSGKIDLSGFSELTRLVNLTIRDSKLESVLLDTRLRTLKALDLSSNRINEFEQICNASALMPSLKTLLLADNSLETLHSCTEDTLFENMDLSGNKIHSMGLFSASLRHLDLHGNRLGKVQDLPGNLVYLNLSQNPIVDVDFPELSSLLSLDMSETKITKLPKLHAAKLRDLRMDQTALFILNANNLSCPQLKRFSLLRSEKLAFVAGTLPAGVSKFALTESKINALPQIFFTSAAHSLREVDVQHNPFDCDPCITQWAVPISPLVQKQVNCTTTPRNSTACLVGISSTQSEVYWAKFGRSAVIPSGAYGNPQAPVVEWWLFRPATYLGSFNFETYEVSYKNVEEETLKRFSIEGGALVLHNVNKTTIERYVCIASNSHGNATRIYKFRLDYSDWYSHNLFESVFWGALAFCIVVCALSFLLNITWILTRKSILWWIQRAERLSRVRKMVEAMEKYRVRQLDNLQEKYTKRVQVVRDNYHTQVEQLRMSYALQAERFRDYRAAQMETVTSHLENIRENYQQQLNRVREYGSRRAEQLWESYERQVNRMKAFSLQHRLKLMRQYKVKQRHLNKLLESFNDSHSPDAMRKHEEEVLAALELPDEAVTGEGGPTQLSRSSSFYSLPEYVLDENGVMRPSPLVPTIRFTRNLKSPPSDTPARKSREHE